MKGEWLDFCLTSLGRAGRKLGFNGGDKMSDLVSYALLAAIFVITGLRMFVEKPKKFTETEALHGQSKGND